MQEKTNWTPWGTDTVKLYRWEKIFGVNHRMAKAYIEYNHDIGFHAHSFYEINLVLSNGGIHCIGDETVPTKAGDVFVIPPYHKHAYHGTEGFHVYNLIFHPNFFERYAPELEKIPEYMTLFEIEPMLRSRGFNIMHLSLNPSELETMKNMFDELAVIDQKEEAEKLIAACRSIIIIVTLCKIYARQEIKSEESNTSVRLADSLTELYAGDDESIKLDTLAEKAGLSRSAFLRKFKSLTGMTPKQFILKKRIVRAMNLLKSTELSIGAIADDCGFFDASHFTKTFAAAIGMNPTEYRKAEK